MSIDVKDWTQRWLRAKSREEQVQCHIDLIRAVQAEDRIPLVSGVACTLSPDESYPLSETYSELNAAVSTTFSSVAAKPEPAAAGDAPEWCIQLARRVKGSLGATTRVLAEMIRADCDAATADMRKQLAELKAEKAADKRLWTRGVKVLDSISALKKQLAERDAEIERLRKRLEKTSCKMPSNPECDCTICSQDRRNAELCDEITRLKTTLTDAEVDRDNFREAAHANKAEVERLRKQLAESSPGALANARDRIRSQEKQIEELKADLAEARKPEAVDDERSFYASDANDTLCEVVDVKYFRAERAARVKAERQRDEYAEFIKTTYLETRTGDGVPQPRQHGRVSDRQFNEALATYRASKADAAGGAK